MKSVVNSTTTYFVGKLYQKRIEGGNTIEEKTYFNGAQAVAMRKNGTLYWLVGDHLGSTNLTASADGTLYSEIRYSAYGEVRYDNGVTPTKYQYTGQLSQMDETGLYYYVARFYDPVISHFTQADTIVPGMGMAMALNRYGYVGFNPIRFRDPSGHVPIIDDDENGNPIVDREWDGIDSNELTENGEDGYSARPDNQWQVMDGQQIYDLYLEYRKRTDAWWYVLGNFTESDFLGLMIMHEMDGLYDIQNLFVDVVGYHLYGDSSNVGGHVPFCGAQCGNGMFNYMSKYVESAQKRVGVPLNYTMPKDPAGPLALDNPNPLRIMQNARKIGDALIKNPQSKWRHYDNSVPYHWGNRESLYDKVKLRDFGPAADQIYAIAGDDFVIYSMGQENNALGKVKP